MVSVDGLRSTGGSQTCEWWPMASRLFLAFLTFGSALGCVVPLTDADASARPDDAGQPVVVVDSGASDRDSGSSDAGSSDAGTADAGIADGGETDAGAGDAGVAITVLADVTLDSGVRYQLLRLQRPAQAATYAQWLPPPDGGVRPVVVLTQPYDGIDWTGEAVDTRWAALGTGFHPDVDGPDFDGGDLAYAPMTPAQAAENATLWRLHGFGVLFLYGRFYAGGDVQNDIDDTAVGFDFLGQSSQVDRARIGILGASWGGFEALYGAAAARPDVRPSAGVALAPLSDFMTERAYITQVLPGRYTQASSRSASASFFDPYLRRLAATTRRAGFAGLTAADLASQLQTPFLLIHEDWDTLVSFEQSLTLVALAPERFAPLWLLHAGPPSPWDQALNTHGPLFQQLYASTLTFAWSFLLTRLSDPGQSVLVPWDAPSFRQLLQLMHDRQAEGKDVRFFAHRLLELTDSRVRTYELSTQIITGGASTVAAEVNAVWGTRLSASTIAAALDGGLP